MGNTADTRDPGPLPTASILGSASGDLKRLNRLAGMGVVAAGVAHEIKNALVPLKTLVTLLSEGRTDPQLFEIAKAELDRIETLSTGMLHAAHRRAPLTEFGVHQVLDRTLRLLQHQFNARMVKLSRQYEATIDRVTGDPGQLQQAFLNLLLNSTEAMDQGGSLYVKTATEPDDGAPGPGFVCVQLIDTGCGIKPEHLARLFEPFFTTKPEGTGLGLLISRGIVQEHGGSIEVDSTPGKGTAFKVRIPAVRAAQA